MKRKSFLKTFLGALGYMEMGNVMSLVLSITLIPYSNNKAITIVFALCAAVVFFSLVFTSAYKDGVKERGFLKRGAENPPKHRRLVISLLLWGISVIFAVVLPIAGDWYRLVYLALNGSVIPLLSLVRIKYAPFAAIGYYALTIPSYLLGYWCGLKDKLNTDKIIYK